MGTSSPKLTQTTASVDSVALEWSSSYSSTLSPANDQAYAIRVNGTDGTTYVTGAGYLSGHGYDIVTVKYTATGDTAWTARYNGSANADDFGISCALDRSGNVFVTGMTTRSDSTFDIVTMKYNASGVRQWVQTYDGSGHNDDTPSAIVTDYSGNVYITGSSVGTDASYDIATVKYSTTGTRLWTVRYASTAHLDDVPVGMAIDPSGFLDVAGNITDASGFSHLAMIHYNSNGVELWWDEYGAGSSNSMEAAAMAVSRTDNIGIAGRYLNNSGGYDYFALQYGSDGAVEWVKQYDGAQSLDDEAFAVGFDKAGNMIVTGGSTGSDGLYDIATIKYDSFGQRQWVQRTANTNSDDIAYVLLLDRANNIYVGGTSAGPGGSADFTLLKYSPAGDLLWKAQHDGRSNSYDYPTGGAIDTLANVYLCGTASLAGHSSMVTLRFSNLPFLSLSPSSVSFSSTQIGCIATQTVYLKNSGSSTANISSSSIQNEFTFSAGSAGVPPLDSIPCTLTFSPLGTGARSGQLSISGNAANSPFLCSIAGTGSGTGSGIHIDVPFSTGWQIISLPVRVACPFAMTGLFKYSNGYLQQSQMVTGTGYWKKLTSSPLGYSGYAALPETIQVAARWNLVGSASSTVPVTALATIPTGNIATPFYSFDGSGYHVADSIKVGHGYWVKMNQVGSLIVKTGPVAATRSSADNGYQSLLDEADRLIFSRRDGQTQTLYLHKRRTQQQTGSRSISNSFELPPRPPDGVFDARFGSGMMLEEYSNGENKTVPIDITGAEDGVEMTWDIQPGISYAIETSGLSRNLAGKGSMVLSSMQHKINIATGRLAQLPKTFSLLQNYPNPFNPSTMISFALPEPGLVSMHICDVSGREVDAFSGRRYDAGTFDVPFDGSRLSSGVYYCRVDFTPSNPSSHHSSAVRSIVLMK